MDEAAHSLCTKFQKSLTNGLEKSPEFFAHFARLLERTTSLLVEAAEVALDISNVELEVIPNDVRILPCGLRVARDEGARRCQTGFGHGWSAQSNE